MRDTSKLRFILHVSDFHIGDDPDQNEQVRQALTSLTKKLKDDGLKVEYLIHTGDVIDSGDLYNRVAEEMGLGDPFWEDEKETGSDKTKKKFLDKKFKEVARANTKLDEEEKKDIHPILDDLKEFDRRVKGYVEERFKLAESIMRDFITDLNVAFGNVIICCGNHDVLRPLILDETEVTCEKAEDGHRDYYAPSETNVMEPFEDFLNKLGVANSKNRCKNSASCPGKEDTACVECAAKINCTLDDLNVLILNTNWANPVKQKPGYYCVRCSQVIQAIDQQRKKEDNSDRSGADNSGKLNVIVAHKPVYEICEEVRLPYKRYTKTSFLSKLQGFRGKNGIYLCGDKHTRSVVASLFHDIPHYIGGEPIRTDKGPSDVEYNLLAISDGRVDMERKLHLSNNDGTTWRCEVRPQDETVKKLYELSWKYINRNSFEPLGKRDSFSTWENLCQVVYNWSEDERDSWYNSIDELYSPICRYRINGIPENNDMPETGTGILQFVQRRIMEQMKNPDSKNVLNIRGEHSSGKSMFLGQLYIHLITEYSKGSFNFIPAYFNMEDKKIYEQMESSDSSDSYCRTVGKAFREFAKEVQSRAKKEHQQVCYLIDGLDELDCWSLSTEDSVGRELLNILSEYENAWYAMSFSQHNLPCFKNTMPLRKYNDASDIMYFNPVDVNEENSKESPFTKFVTAFFHRRGFPPKNYSVPLSSGSVETIELNGDQILKDVCEMIQSFRRLTINPGFLFDNYDYLTAINGKNGALQHKDTPISQVYNYYIDRQHDLCMDELGYGFIDYAPSMAYLFAYKGYTYEKFKDLHFDSSRKSHHVLDPICKNKEKVYKAFLFIMKNKDAREYLIALHYNRELRYYAEHLNESIDENSILNEFITRNIAVLIRKLWTDTNKFIIACEHLLQRTDIGNCAQSMLIYCLAHLQMYEPIRNRLQEKMRQKAIETLTKQGLWDETIEQVAADTLGIESIGQSTWTVSGKNAAEKLAQFQQLSLKHSMEIFNLIADGNPDRWIKLHQENHSFCTYNRQYQMLYYGDLSAKNDANIHALKPGNDVIHGGFDFHDCFNYLYVKLMSERNYLLKAYDLFTICDLLISRLKCECDICSGNKENTFFYRPKDRERASMVRSQVDQILCAIKDLHHGEYRNLCQYFQNAVNAVTSKK